MILRAGLREGFGPLAVPSIARAHARTPAAALTHMERMVLTCGNTDTYGDTYGEIYGVGGTYARAPYRTPYVSLKTSYVSPYVSPYVSVNMQVRTNNSIRVIGVFLRTRAQEGVQDLHIPCTYGRLIYMMKTRETRTRNLWARTEEGEPLSLIELAMIRLVVMMAIVLGVFAATDQTGTPVALALFSYLVLERVQVIIDWIRRIK